MTYHATSLGQIADELIAELAEPIPDDFRPDGTAERTRMAHAYKAGAYDRAAAKARLISRATTLEDQEKRALREADREWSQLAIRDNARIVKLEGIVRMLANFDARNSIVHLRDIARAALAYKGNEDV